MTEGTVGGCPWASGHPTLLLAMSKVLRTGGKESSAFTPVSVPLNIPGHPLEGTSVLPSSPWCLGPPECPSALREVGDLPLSPPPPSHMVLDLLKITLPAVPIPTPALSSP